MILRDYLVMPRHDVHEEMSESPSAREIHRLLDLPIGMTHFEYREMTHDPVVAYLVGYIVDGRRGGRDAIRHLMADEVLNRIQRFLE